MHRFNNWLKPPIFEDYTEKTITAGLLNSILLINVPAPIIVQVDLTQARCRVISG